MNEEILDLHTISSEMINIVRYEFHWSTESTELHGFIV